MKAKNYKLYRQLELIKTINVQGCGGYKEAFEVAQKYATKGIKEYKELQKKEAIDILNN